MAQMKTPGVYLKEINAFPNSVVEVATAVPAFIGYTEKAENGSKKLKNIPFRITSLSEYFTYFGGAPDDKFTLSKAVNDDATNAAAEAAAQAIEDANKAITAAKNAVEAAKTKGDKDYQANEKAAKEALAAAEQAFKDATAAAEGAAADNADADAKAKAAEAAAKAAIKATEAAKAVAKAGDAGNTAITAVNEAIELANKAIDVAKNADDNDAAAEAAKAAKAAAKAAKAAAVAGDDEAAKAADTAEAAAIKAVEAAAKAYGGGDLKVKEVSYNITREENPFRLYNALRLFYQNGGGPCHIVSVGNYEGEISGEKLSGTGKNGGGLLTLEKEQEPTMILIPDALSLDEEDCYTVYQQVLKHCVKMQSRIGIFDVYKGFLDRKDEKGDMVEKLRSGIGMNGLKYGTAYYPWVHTTIVAETEISFNNLKDDSLKELQNMITEELTTHLDTDTDSDKKKKDSIKDYLNNITKYDDKTVKNWYKTNHDDTEEPPESVNQSLITLSPAYNELLKHIQEDLNELPPASAMAGIYTMVDATRGVWKAPGNVSLNSVVKPSVNITFEDQEDLNVSLTGKSINAIRSFIGEGVIVWGARTLDGNSKDWKYISVRRTVIMLEQSVKAAAKAYVFEPNVAGTWSTVKSMIENFLYQQWKNGALAGTSPEDAYSVHVGLGDTMTADDILEGIMRVTVLIAVSKPAEFIEITFQQQMQKS